MARRKTVRRSRTPKKLFAKIKKDGVFKGTGDWAGSQIGGELGKITKKAVPAFMLLTAISAVTRFYVTHRNISSNAPIRRINR